MVTLHDIAKSTNVSAATVSRVLNGKGGIARQTAEKVLAAAKAAGYKSEPSLRDVAELAGVSAATASNVLNGRNVSHSCRAAVLQAAAQLSYQPRGQVAGRRKSVIYASQDSPVDIINSINTTANQLGYHVFYMPTTIYPADAYLQYLDSGQAAGIIFFNCSDSGLIRRCAARYPTVQCGAYTDIPGSHIVAIDYEQAARELLGELLDHGKKRIWFLTDLDDKNSQVGQYAQVYIAGLKRALQERGLPEAGVVIQDLGPFGLAGDFDYHSRIVEKWLSLPVAERPDALLCMNGTLAAAYINLLALAGIRVPEDIAIASFLGGRHDKQCRPYVTSLQPPNRSLGSEAMTVVADLIDGTKPRPKIMLFGHRIRFGGSTRQELCPFGLFEK